MIDYDYGFISPVAPLRFNPPRIADRFNSPQRKGHNPDYEGPGDRVGHKGVDIGPPAGTFDAFYFCPADGKVHAAKWLNTGAGMGIELVHPADNPKYLTRGLHFKMGSLMGSLLVTAGDLVTQGQPLATIGNTAIPKVNWIHTHFEIRWLRDGYDPHLPGVAQGIPLDPLDFGILDVTPPADLELVTLTIHRPVLRIEVPPYTIDPAVKDLQHHLNGLGLMDRRGGINYNLATGDWDGQFGPSTEASVKEFQALESLTVDGIVGGQTLEALIGY